MRDVYSFHRNERRVNVPAAGVIAITHVSEQRLWHNLYSLLVALNRPAQPKMSGPVLALDRATLTAHLKTLRRRGLVDVVPDNTDRRSGRVVLTDKGRDLLAEAVPIWRAAQDEIDSLVVGGDVRGLKADLLALTFGETSP